MAAARGVHAGSRPATHLKPPPSKAGADLSDWLDDIGSRIEDLSDDELLQVQRWLGEVSSKSGNSAAQAVASDVELAIEERKGAASAAARDRILQGKPAEADVDGDGTVSQIEREGARSGTDQAKGVVTSTVEQQAKAQGATEREAKAAGEEAWSAAYLISDLPPIPPILQQYVTAPNGRPTPQQVQDLIQAWNTLNPLAPVTNEKELFDRLGQGGSAGGPIQKQVIEVGLLGAEPLIDYRIPTIDGDTYTVSAQTFELLNRQFGYSSAEMTTAVRTAARAGLMDGRGEPAWQMLLGLANATRQRQLLTPDTTNPQTGVAQLSERIQSLNRQKGVLINRARNIAERSPGRSEEYESIMAQVDQIDRQLQEATAQLPGSRAAANSAGVAIASQNYSNSQTIQNLAAQYSAARSLYGGDDMLAMLQVVDPSLAARVAVTDPGKLSLDDQRAVQEIFLDAGLAPEDLAALGYVFTSNYDAAGNRRGGSGGSGGRVRNLPDPVAVKQAATDLYRSLFAADPTEAQLQALAGAVTSAIMTAPDDQSVDPNARLRQAVEGLPEYQTFYGNKPEGMSDAEYRAQFDQGAGGILGATAADPTTIQAGLRTGKVQTAVGAAAAQKSAWESSTFMGRLAAAAQQISEWT